MSYSDNTLAVIEQSGFLSTSDFAFVQSSIGDIQTNWQKQQRFRTETEMHVSVLQDIKHPTSASKYWQAIREQSVMYQELVSLSFEYRRNEIKMAKLNDKLKKAAGYKRDLLQIDLEEAEFNGLNMHEIAKDRMREIRLWAGILKELDDGSFNTDDVNAHQLKSYTERFARQVNNMGDNAPPADRINLVGQLQTAVRVTEEKGLLTDNEKLKLAGTNHA